MTTSHHPVSYGGFLSRVEREAGLTRHQAERAVQATLQTLGERLSSGEARDLAAELPPELAAMLATDTKAQALDLEEFMRRVGEREGADVAEAQEHVRAVLAALGQTISQKELHDIASELPKGFAALLSGAYVPAIEQPERPPTVSADEFVKRVARHAGLSRTEAVRATDAVLEVLAERISGGQVDDLAVQLPDELYPPLQRGKIRSHAAARPLSLAEFVHRIAEREGVPPDHAHEHARAVLRTLREVVSDREFSDTLAQLPHEYRAMLAPPASTGSQRDQPQDLV
jgi:uncharacterized protein (DUF2267 family)